MLGTANRRAKVKKIWVKECINTLCGGTFDLETSIWDHWGRGGGVIRCTFIIFATFKKILLLQFSFLFNETFCNAPYDGLHNSVRSVR